MPRAPALRLAFTKGAVDGLLESLRPGLGERHVEPLDDDWHERIQKPNNDAWRRRACACWAWPSARWKTPAKAQRKTASWNTSLIFVGLIGMIDPARPEVRAAVATREPPASAR